MRTTPMIQRSRSGLAAGLLSLVLALASHGCGGSKGSSSPGPTAPSLPTGPSSLTLVSGETGQPVGGATVVFAGQSLRADARGVLSVPPGSTAGAFMDVIAPGFLDRQTLFRLEGSPTLSLWPRNSSSGLDENFTAVLVYTSPNDGAATGAAPMIRHRPTTTVVTMVLSPALAADAESVRWHQLAADSINTAINGRIIYRVATERPSSGATVDVTYDPSNAQCSGGFRGFTSWRTSGGEITTATIVYCVSEAPRSGTVVHEMGHTFGLGHSPDPRDVMYFSFVRGRSEVYTPKETLAMKLMLGRPAGTRFPDNDRETSGMASEGGIHTIRCR